MVCKFELPKYMFNDSDDGICYKDANFIKETYGLKIDDLSEYEDCAYVEGVSGESSQEHLSRIENMVNNMIKSISWRSWCISIIL